MFRLLKASFYKLSRDLTFRVILIVGAALALLIVLSSALINYVYNNMSSLVDTEELGEEGAAAISLVSDINMKFVSGQGMLVGSSSPTANFGIAVIICLAIFVCLEFSQGTIRNKIISGYSKVRIYISLVLTGIIIAVILMAFYLIVITILGTLFGGFNLKELTVVNLSNVGYVDVSYIMQVIVVTLVTYLSVAALTIFVSTLFRSVGPAIAVSFVPLMIFGFICGFFGANSTLPDQLIPFQNFLKWFYPFYTIDNGTINDPDNFHFLIGLDTFIPCIINNLVFTAGISALGAFIFMKRDVK